MSDGAPMAAKIITRRECPEHGSCLSRANCHTHGDGTCCCDHPEMLVERTYVAVDALYGDEANASMVEFLHKHTNLCASTNACLCSLAADDLIRRAIRAASGGDAC